MTKKTTKPAAAKTIRLPQEPAVAPLAAAYRQARTKPAQAKALVRIIQATVQNPEGPAAKVLVQIARKGETRCIKAIDPLLAVFWDGDFEWQEAIVMLLGELALLVNPAGRAKLGQFLGHVAVSEVFVGGSGVDYAAVKALERLACACGTRLMRRVAKRGRLVVCRPGDARRAFEAEVS
jgi:hypothetical protein